MAGVGEGRGRLRLPLGSNPGWGEGPPAPARAWHSGQLWGGGSQAGEGPGGRPRRRAVWRRPELAREGLRLPQLQGWAGGARPVAAEQLRNLFS